MRSAVMARIRSKNTGPELLLRKALFRLGHRFRIHYGGAPGRPDVAFPSQRVAVFVHGCFWHGCPLHYVAPTTRGDFWKKKLLSNRNRDKKRRRELRNEGWRIVEFWEHQVEHDPTKCAKKVSGLVKPRSPTPT